MVTPGRGRFQVAAATGGCVSQAATIASSSAPYWVQLTRSGTVFTADVSADGVHWTPAGKATLSVTGTLYIGLASDSGDAGLLNTATLQQRRGRCVAQQSAAWSPRRSPIKRPCRGRPAIWTRGRSSRIRARAICNTRSAPTAIRTWCGSPCRTSPASSLVSGLRLLARQLGQHRRHGHGHDRHRAFCGNHVHAHGAPRTGRHGALRRPRRDASGNDSSGGETEGSGTTTGSVSVLSGGTLLVNSFDTLSAYNDLVIGDGATVELAFDDNSSGIPAVMYGGVIQFGDGTVDGSLNSGIELADANLSVLSSTDQEFDGDISGTGSVTKDGAGTLTLGGQSTYTGLTRSPAARFSPPQMAASANTRR